MDLDASIIISLMILLFIHNVGYIINNDYDFIIIKI